MASKPVRDRDEAVAPVGGQAVIEGVMMRSKAGYAVGLLGAKGKVSVKWFPYLGIALRKPWTAKPFLRGMIALFESMAIGIRALLYSASEQVIEEPDAKKRARLEKDRAAAKKTSEKLELSRFQEGLMVAVSLLLGLGLFVVVPNLLIELIGLNEKAEPVLFNVISGAVRIAFFVAYVFLISLMKDVKRLFQFHGAEHKAVNAHEAGLPATVANAGRFTTLHPRCGTSFMFFVLVVAIVLFAFVPMALKAWWPWFNELTSVPLQKLIIIPIHILLLPFVAGIAYEVIRFSWRKRNLFGVKYLMYPGFALQKITTREPDATQVAVAVAALQEALKQQRLAGLAEDVPADGQRPQPGRPAPAAKGAKPVAKAAKRVVKPAAKAAKAVKPAVKKPVAKAAKPAVKAVKPATKAVKPVVKKPAVTPRRGSGTGVKPAGTTRSKAAR